MIEVFWDDIEKIPEIEKKKVYDKIEAEWGKSSVTLKNWLQLYYPFIVNNKAYSKKNDINANIFLPPRKGKLWTCEEAITRLKLAVKAEVLVIFSGKTPDKSLMGIYKVECLRLWTCINSLVTRFSFNQFMSLLDETLFYVLNHWDETVKLIKEKTEVYKPRRDQILYHYKREDFEHIRYEKNCKAAYDKWIVEVWPTLLDKYKAQKLDEYSKTLRNMTSEDYFKYRSEYNERLNKIKITKIGYVQFTKIIKKLKMNEL